MKTAALAIAALIILIAVAALTQKLMAATDRQPTSESCRSRPVIYRSALAESK
jgi:hypothetical protein